jgi:hypothetical protein
LIGSGHFPANLREKPRMKRHFRICVECGGLTLNSSP